jgi:hypothetical protein
MRFRATTALTLLAAFLAGGIGGGYLVWHYGIEVEELNETIALGWASEKAQFFYTQGQIPQARAALTYYLKEIEIVRKSRHGRHDAILDGDSALTLARLSRIEQKAGNEELAREYLTQGASFLQAAGTPDASPDELAAIVARLDKTK